MKRFDWYELFHSYTHSQRGGTADAPNPYPQPADNLRLAVTCDTPGETVRE